MWFQIFPSKINNFQTYLSKNLKKSSFMNYDKCLLMNTGNYI